MSYYKIFCQSWIKYRVINPVEQNTYKFCLDETSKNWRQISQPINLTFPQNIEPNLRSSYDWILNNAETTILKFFQTIQVVKAQ
jgi:CRISPR-associated endonuclease/helicase Cas3